MEMESWNCNDGTINITGANSTAIYVENNNGAAQTDVTITNNKSLTLGDNSSGIVLKSGSGVGGLINVSGTGKFRYKSWNKWLWNICKTIAKWL